MYEKIHEFCKVKNKGGCYENGSEPTPRVQWLMKLLEELGIEYELDTFQKRSFLKMGEGRAGNNFFNIVMRGSSNRMVVAHHDIVNPSSDNANDNSCSVINCIAIKKAMPEMNVILLDGEESGGIGSEHAAERIKNGDFGNIEFVLNLELTGKGGKYFFLGDYPGPLSDRIKKLFPLAPVCRTPFNDAVTFRRHKIDSVVINPLPPLVKEPETDEFLDEDDDDWGSMELFGRYSYLGGKKSPENKRRFTIPKKKSDMVMYGDVELDFSILYRCHSMTDSLDKIDTKDMEEFVNEVCLKILG